MYIQCTLLLCRSVKDDVLAIEYFAYIDGKYYCIAGPVKNELKTLNLQKGKQL